MLVLKGWLKMAWEGSGSAGERRQLCFRIVWRWFGRGFAEESVDASSVWENWYWQVRMLGRL